MLAPAQPHFSSKYPATPAHAPVFFMAYVSSAKADFNDEALVQLLEVSKRNNAARGITGMLLYHQGNFIQVLEGPEADVVATRSKIFNDPRHHTPIVLLKGNSSRREFGDWSMGFFTMNPRERRALEGFSDFLRHSHDDSTPESKRLWKLLKTFRRNLR